MWEAGWIRNGGGKKVHVWIKCEASDDGGVEEIVIVVNAQGRALVKYHVSPEARVFDANPEAVSLRPKAPVAAWKRNAPDTPVSGDVSEPAAASDWKRYAATVPDFFLADSDDDEEDPNPRVSLLSSHIKRELTGPVYAVKRKGDLQGHREQRGNINGEDVVEHKYRHVSTQSQKRDTDSLYAGKRPPSRVSNHQDDPVRVKLEGTSEASDSPSGEAPSSYCDGDRDDTNDRTYGVKRQDDQEDKYVYKSVSSRTLHQSQGTYDMCAKTSITPKPVKREASRSGHVPTKQETSRSGHVPTEQETSRSGHMSTASVLGGTILGKRHRLPDKGSREPQSRGHDKGFEKVGRRGEGGEDGGIRDGNVGAKTEEDGGDDSGGEDRARKKQRETSTSANYQADASALICGFPNNTILGWSDGSSHGNPGPAGAGAVVCVPSDDAKSLKGRARLLSTCEVGDPRCGVWVQGWHALGKETNNVGELEAIAVALEIGGEARRTHSYLRSAPIKILTDSKYSQGALDKNQAKKNVALIKSIKANVVNERATVHWVKGHAGVPGNVRADALATEASIVSRRELQKSDAQGMEFRRIKTVTNVERPF
jgi:ribonuclease HI